MEAKDLLEEYVLSWHGACRCGAMPAIMRHVFHASGQKTDSVVKASRQSN
jgi:hypothetical protein